MANLRVSKGALFWLLLIVYCEAKPLESTEQPYTTPCPEELKSFEIAEENVENIPQTNAGLHTESSTTICPEELEKRKLEGNIHENVENNIIVEEENHVNFVNPEENLDATTICSEELEKRKQEEANVKNPQEKISKLDEDHVKFVVPEENIDITTTCPEELEKRKQDEIASKNIAANEMKLINIEENVDTTTICPEELEKRKEENDLEKIKNDLKDSENEVKVANAENNIDTTTICPEELEKQKLESLNEKLNDQSENNSNENGEISISPENQQETTICPEELEKQKLENQEKDSENEKNDQETTICPEELARKQLEQKLNAEQGEFLTELNEKTDIPENQSKAHQDEEDQFRNEVDINKLEVTTVCPEELLKSRDHQNTLETDTKLEDSLKKQQKIKGNEIPANTLLDVQKDSVLLKLLYQSNAQLKESTHEGGERHKRQSSDYTPYYSNQPSYNSQGVAVSSSSDTQNYNTKAVQPSPGTAYQGNQQPQYYTRSSSQSQNHVQKMPMSYNNVRTYQQIQRQYQGLYPKTNQKYAKPVVNSYRNPVSYARYPSNGNLKNYYKRKAVTNRRQFQGQVRASSTTARPTRATIKKKFRPSPVFP